MNEIIPVENLAPFEMDATVMSRSGDSGGTERVLCAIVGWQVDSKRLVRPVLMVRSANTLELLPPERTPLLMEEFEEARPTLYNRS